MFEGVAPRFLSVPFLAVNFKLCTGPLSEPPGRAGTCSEVCTPICVPLGRSLTFPRISVLIKEAKTSIFSPHISIGLRFGSLAMTGEKSIFVQRSPFDTVGAVSFLWLEENVWACFPFLQRVGGEGQSSEEKGAAVKLLGS